MNGACFALFILAILAAPHYWPLVHGLVKDWRLGLFANGRMISLWP